MKGIKGHMKNAIPLTPPPLTPELLYSAYCQGYFPLPEQASNTITWFRPDPRAIIPLHEMHISRSLRRVLRRNYFTVTYDRAFAQVMAGCADRPETWINQEFIDLYQDMFNLGFAHSVEVWEDGKLVGGTYGVSIGGAFFAESMFYRADNASKVALYYLVERLKEQGFMLLECQFLTKHIASLGAVEVSDKFYMRLLSIATQLAVNF
jgi:leucyl/phenylalanyl-tRNA--protein transferase